jgi:hypothetical protein
MQEVMVRHLAELYWFPAPIATQVLQEARVCHRATFPGLLRPLLRSLLPVRADVKEA